MSINILSKIMKTKLIASIFRFQQINFHSQNFKSLCNINEIYYRFYLKKKFSKYRKKSVTECSIPKYSLQKKTALIIGGSSGIGFETARELIHFGCKHVMIAGQSREKCGKAAACLRRICGEDNISCVCFDVTNPREYEEALMYAVDKVNYIDIIVNCFGVFDGENWEREINTNAISMIRGTLLAYDFLGTDSVGCGGVIVNVAGIMGLEPMTGAPSLTAAKHAVVGFSRSYGSRATEAETNVKLITVCPGITMTRLWTKASDKAMAHCECELQRNLDLFCTQKATACAKSIAYVIQNADTGSVWTVEGSRLYSMNFPPKRCISNLEVDFSS